MQKKELTGPLVLNSQHIKLVFCVVNLTLSHLELSPSELGKLEIENNVSNVLN